MRGQPVIVGIDNGLTGAVVAINARCDVCAYFDTPTISVGKRTRYDVAAMVRTLDVLIVTRFDVRCVLIEKGQPMRNGVIATWLSGYCEGAWVAIVVSLGLAHEIVSARTWQKGQLASVSGDSTKDRAVLAAQRAFPNLPLMPARPRRKPYDGRADAALLARYGVTERGLLGGQRV